MSEKHFTRLLLVLSLLSALMFSCTSSRLSVKETADLKKLGWKKKAEKALYYMNKRYFNKAIQVYKLIIDTPGISLKQASWSRYEIGFCYRMMKKYKLALINFEMVVKKYPQDSAKPARILAKRQIKKLKDKKYDGI